MTFGLILRQQYETKLKGWTVTLRIARVFREHIRMDPIDPQANGPQLFYGLRYHIHINTPEEDITFHDQVGYWLWEPATGLILQSVTIPRGQVLLASGHANPDDRKISVTARRGETRYGICSTDFLDEAFRTDSYRCDISFNADGSWTYLIETELLVKGRDQPFNHHTQHLAACRGGGAKSVSCHPERSRREEVVSSGRFHLLRKSKRYLDERSDIQGVVRSDLACRPSYGDTR